MERIGAHVRHRKAAGLLGIVVVAASMTILPARDSASGKGPETGYDISIVSVNYAEDEVTGAIDPTRARIEYNVSWATDNFPGLRQCMWQVRDSWGRIVGSMHGTLQAAQRAYDGTFAQHVPVRGEPETAEADCDSARLDNPDRRLRPTNVRLKEGSLLAGAEYSVAFDLAWIGAGKPSPQRCVTYVYDANGELLFTDERGLGVDEGTGHVSLPVFAPRDIQGQPASAEVSCSSLHR